VVCRFGTEGSEVQILSPRPLLINKSAFHRRSSSVEGLFVGDFEVRASKFFESLRIGHIFASFITGRRQAFSVDFGGKWLPSTGSGHQSVSHHTASVGMYIPAGNRISVSQNSDVAQRCNRRSSRDRRRVQSRDSVVVKGSFALRAERERLLCATEVVLPSLKIKRALPLNQPVDIEFTPDIAFACGMEMLSGLSVWATLN
jgi:hypothetical protein